MTHTSPFHLRRRLLVLPALALLAAGVAAPVSVAHASPVFDVDGYSACTVDTAPAAGQDFDALVTNCCVQHAGTPAPTRYGIGCVAATDESFPGDRPTIVLPARPAAPEESQDAQDALNDLPGLSVPEPLP